MGRHSPGSLTAPPPQVILGARKAARLTRAEFARFAEVSAATVGRWERGESTPRGLQLKELRRVLSTIESATSTPANETINKAIIDLLP